jgi:hypothetical protein
MNPTLSPLLYVRRNPGKAAPIATVIVLAVVLVASVVSIIHSVDLTIYTLYGYNKYLTGLTPRNALEIPEDQIAKFRKLSQAGPIYRTHSYQLFIKTIFGKMPFPVFGLTPPAMHLMMQRTGVSLAAGRLPARGAPEAAISGDVARNLGVHIGSVLLQPNSRDDYAPVPIKLVGLLKGPCWVGLMDRSLPDKDSPLTFSGYLAFAPNPTLGAQRALDNAIAKAADRTEVHVWRFAGLVRETRSALSNLYLILNIVIAIIIFAIAFVCGLLSNIYFTQRLPEVATLSAIGYTRGMLLRRTVGETTILCIIGWLAGVGVTVGLLMALAAFVLRPRGLLLNPVDPRAFMFTLPLPIIIVTFAVVTVGLRLRALDPVSIIERRG